MLWTMVGVEVDKCSSLTNLIKSIFDGNQHNILGYVLWRFVFGKMKPPALRKKGKITIFNSFSVIIEL